MRLVKLSVDRLPVDLVKKITPHHSSVPEEDHPSCSTPAWIVPSNVLAVLLLLVFVNYPHFSHRDGKTGFT